MPFGYQHVEPIVTERLAQGLVNPSDEPLSEATVRAIVSAQLAAKSKQQMQTEKLASAEDQLGMKGNQTVEQLRERGVQGRLNEAHTTDEMFKRNVDDTRVQHAQVMIDLEKQQKLAKIKMSIDQAINKNAIDLVRAKTEGDIRKIDAAGQQKMQLEQAKAQIEIEAQKHAVVAEQRKVAFVGKLSQQASSILAANPDIVHVGQDPRLSLVAGMMMSVPGNDLNVNGLKETLNLRAEAKAQQITNAATSLIEKAGGTPPDPTVVQRITEVAKGQLLGGQAVDVLGLAQPHMDRATKIKAESDAAEAHKAAVEKELAGYENLSGGKRAENIGTVRTKAHEIKDPVERRAYLESQNAAHGKANTLRGGLIGAGAAGLGLYLVKKMFGSDNDEAAPGDQSQKLALVQALMQQRGGGRGMPDDGRAEEMSANRTLAGVQKMLAIQKMMMDMQGMSAAGQPSVASLV